MPDNNKLDHLFPRLTDIPDTWRPDAPVEQREYLVNGELRRWDGPLAPVRSPIFLAGDEGDQQVILGSTPLLDADAALAALDAAVAAYDNGQGLWPNLRVAERIAQAERGQIYFPFKIELATKARTPNPKIICIHQNQKPKTLPIS